MASIAEATANLAALALKHETGPGSGLGAAEGGAVGGVTTESHTTESSVTSISSSPASSTSSSTITITTIAASPLSPAPSSSSLSLEATILRKEERLLERSQETGTERAQEPPRGREHRVIEEEVEEEEGAQLVQAPKQRQQQQQHQQLEEGGKAREQQKEKTKQGTIPQLQPPPTQTQTQIPIQLPSPTVSLLPPMRAISTQSPAIAAACPNCGAGIGHKEGGVVKVDFGLRLVDDDPYRRIVELEAQVKLLSDKATAAVDKLADYEDELQRKKRHKHQTPPTQANGSANPHPLATPPTASSSPTASTVISPTNRITNFLSLTTRRNAGPPSPPIDPSEITTPTATTATSRPSSPTSSSSATPLPPQLLAQLEKERTLRLQAEAKLAQVTNELEELSESLFTQANEMVAEERRTNARLQQRLNVVEKREREKSVRLGRLEGAVDRIGRVRGLLGEESAVRISRSSSSGGGGAAAGGSSRSSSDNGGGAGGVPGVGMGMGMGVAAVEGGGRMVQVGG